MTRTPQVEILMEQRTGIRYRHEEPGAEGTLYERVPLAMLGEPEEVAEAVLYLATASFCTRTILNISGANVRVVMW